MKVIDLTHPITNEQVNIELTPDSHLNNHGITMSWIKTHSHAGTHMDAPLHFLPDGSTMEKMPLEKCAGPGVVLDMTHIEADGFITVEDLRPYASKITAKSRVLLRTDWGQYLGQSKYRDQFPRIHVDAAKWLAEKDIWLIGVEHPSVAKLGNLDELKEVHHAFLKKEIVIVEGLTNLNLLPETFTFVAVPLKVVGGDGSPTRAIALVDEINDFFSGNK